MKEKCAWEAIEYEGLNIFNTSCGVGESVGLPSDYVYCPYCGEEIEVFVK